VVYTQFINAAAGLTIKVGVPRFADPCSTIQYRGADKSLALVFSVQGTSGSPTGPDPENRVGDQDIESPGRSVSSGCNCPVSRFLPGRAKDLSAPLLQIQVSQ
jgi:hypothetical protein